MHFILIGIFKCKLKLSSMNFLKVYTVVEKLETTKKHSKRGRQVWSLSNFTKVDIAINWKTYKIAYQVAKNKKIKRIQSPKNY